MRGLITLCCYLTLVTHLLGYSVNGDTTPPVIITEASDLSVSCKTNYIDSLLLWHSEFGGLVAMDNDSIAAYVATITADDLVNAFEASQLSGCINDAGLSVGFFAIDTCGNSTVDTSYATFSVFDIERPVILNQAADTLLTCDAMFSQNLQLWIDSHGGSTAVDSCSTVAWNEYIWADNQGNNGFAQIGEPYDLIIDRTDCEWFMDVSFFAVDECGNRQPTNARLSIVDTIAPVFVSIPQDITVTCDSIPVVDSLVVLDYCDGIIKYFPEEFDSKSNDPSQCDYYNYLIERVWRVSDACGNMLTHTQTIEVIDTIGPLISINQFVTIGCDRDTLGYLQFATIEDQCGGEFEVDYLDQEIASGCNAGFQRSYTVTDVCGNTSTAIQQINTVDNDPPQLIQAPQSLEIYCESSVDYEEVIQEWLDSLGYAQIFDECQQVNGFGAEPGSFSISDPNTYPGAEPSLQGEDLCQIRAGGLMYTESVIFVFADDCDNIVQSIKSINVYDTLAPIITNCPENLEISLENEDCAIITTLPIPDYVDNCLGGDETQSFTMTQQLTSDNPGSQTSVIDPLTFRFTDVDPNILGSGNSELSILFSQIDGNGTQEYFNILIEGTSYGRSPQLENECDNASMIILGVTQNTLLAWLSDGEITVELIPNNTPSNLANTVNDICSESSITLEWTMPIENQNIPRIFYAVDGQDQVESSSTESILVLLEEGNHEVEFFIEDCGGNVASCITEVVVIDNVPPTISCPSDTIIYVDAQCQSEYLLSTDFIYIDNCISAGQVSQSQPAQGPGFLSFQLDNQVEDFVASNRQYQFNIPNAEDRVLENPQLKIDFAGNTSSAIASLIDEQGKTLIDFTEAEFTACSEVMSVTLEIDQESFENWVEDDKVIVVFESNLLEPCGPLEEGFDNFSRLKLTLTYSDIQPDYTITGDTLISGSITDLLNPPSHNLGLGTYIIEYSVFDATGNAGMCDFAVIVADTTAPSVLCSDTLVYLPVDGLMPYVIANDLVVASAMDNCAVANISFAPLEIDCSLLGTTVNVITTVQDASGNETQCLSTVEVLVESITPTFSIGLCQGDALELNANVPDNNDTSVLTYQWSGPSGFLSTDPSPVINNPSSLNAGAYTVNIAGLNGCSVSGTVNVIVNQFQDPELATTNDQFCIGDDIILSTDEFGTGVTYTWYEGVAPNLIVIAQTEDPILQLSPQQGQHLYSVVVTNEECTSNLSNTIEILVSDKPTASVASPFVSVCEGEIIQLESDGDISGQNIFTWSGPNGYTGTGHLPEAILNASQANEGNYILQVDNNGCLSDTATVQVIVFDKPTTPILTGENVLCEGGNFNISAQNIAGADQFTWLLNGILFSTTTTSDLTIPNANGSLSGDWQCYIEENLCSSEASQVFVVSVESSLQVGVSNNSPVCVGDTVLLNATFIPDATYTWTSPSGSVINGQKPEVIAEEGEYVLNIITNSGCSIDESTFVTVTNPPIITAISNTAPSCDNANQAISFTPTVFPVGDYQYTWSGPNDFVSNVENPSITGATSLQNGTYTLVVSIDGCDSDPQFTEVAIDGIPAQPNIVTVNNTCEGEILQLTTDVESSGSTVYIWNTPNGIVETTTNLYFSANVGVQNSGQYSVSIEDDNCTSLESNPIIVSIVSEPPIPLIDVPSIACAGETIVLQVLQPQPGLTYTWNTPSGGQFVGPTYTINEAGPSDIGNYAVEVSNGNCVNDQLVSDNLFIRSLPNPPIIASNDTIICASSIEQYAFCISQNIFFNYDSIHIIDQQLDSILVTTNTPCSLLDLSYANGETLFLGAVGFAQTCQSEVSEITIIDIENDDVVNTSFVEDSLLICDEEVDLVLLNLSEDIDSFSISASAGITTAIDTLFGTVMLDTLFDGAQLVLSSYTEYCGLVGSDTLVYTFEEVFQLTDDIIVIEDTGDMSLDVLANDQLPPEYDLSIVSEPMRIGVSVEDNMLSTTVPIDVIGSDQFDYQVCSAICPTQCDTATVILVIGDDSNCIVSNMLTPNDDGYNDTFRVPCLDSGAYPDHELLIFNRWGDQVYIAAPYENDWKAEYNGEPLPSGTYFYILNLKDGSQPLQGFIAVER